MVQLALPAGAQIRRLAPAAIRRLTSPPGWVAALPLLDRRRSSALANVTKSTVGTNVRSGMPVLEATDRGIFPEPPRPEDRPAPVPEQKRFPRSVLLVEDNPGDIRLVREAVASSSVHPRLTIAQDGLEALRMLQK